MLELSDMDDFYTNKIVEIIDKIHYATLATVSPGGDPFNAPVFTAYDDDLVFYWSSSVGSQHSLNIAENGKVYMAIYDSTVAQGTGWGVYVQATARQVTRPEEVELVMKLLGDRRGKAFDKPVTDMIEGDHRVFKATPTAIWINDAEQDDNGEFVKDYRVKVSIENIKQTLSSTQTVPTPRVVPSKD